MDPLNNIMNLIEAQNAEKELADYLGIGEHNIELWKNGDSKTYILHLKKIAEYFDVTTDYLLGKTKEKAPENKIDKRMVQLLALFDKLNDQGKQKAIEYLCDISSLSKYSADVPSSRRHIGYTMFKDSTKKIVLTDDEVAEITRIRKNIKSKNLQSKNQ